METFVGNKTTELDPVVWVGVWEPAASVAFIGGEESGGVDVVAVDAATSASCSTGEPKPGMGVLSADAVDVDDGGVGNSPPAGTPAANGTIDGGADGDGGWLSSETESPGPCLLR